MCDLNTLLCGETDVWLKYSAVWRDWLMCDLNTLLCGETD